jgi:hypothetical protein
MGGLRTMTGNRDPEETDGERSTASGVRVVHINSVKHDLDRDREYTAEDLIELANDDPADHDLVATKGESGRDDKVFDDSEVIDFDEQHRTHFETKADGDTYI